MWVIAAGRGDFKNICSRGNPPREGTDAKFTNQSQVSRKESLHAREYARTNVNIEVLKEGISLHVTLTIKHK